MFSSINFSVGKMERIKVVGTIDDSLLAKTEAVLDEAETDGSGYMRRCMEYISAG